MMRKEQWKRIWTGTVAAVLALSMSFAASAEEILAVSGVDREISLVSSANGNETPEMSLEDALDFSRDKAVSAQAQQASTLLDSWKGKWTGSAPSEAEYTYLKAEKIALSYDEAVSGGSVSTTVEGNTLTVTMRAESYVADNGATVTWIPARVTIGKEEKVPTLSADESSYEAVFSGLDTEALHQAELTWRAEMTLGSAVVKKLINRAYNDASAMIEAQAQYESDLAAHEAAMTRYRADMEAYNTQNTRYQEYVKQKAAYDAELAAYNDYLSKVKAYEEGLAAYEAYQTALTKYDTAYANYQAILASMQSQQDAYNQYQQYLAQIQQAKAKLAVLDSVFVTDSQGRSMYGTLMGDTVATVVARKAELVAAGASAADVDNAGAATELLKSLLNAYRAQSSDQGKYAWYRNNYQALKSGFSTLYNSLYSLHQNALVRTALNAKGKLERYRQFVSQLYVIYTGLEDGVTRSSTWMIASSSYSRLLESVQIVADTNAASPTVSWPAYVSPVEKPLLPTAPTKPAVVAQPVKTWTQELSAPTNKPDEVAQPVLPILSDYTAGEPTQPIATAELEAVMALVKSGKLKARTWSEETTVVTAETSLTRAVTLSGQPAVTFYNYDRKTVCYAVHVTEGSPVFYEGEAPVWPTDAQYTYTFTGWVDADGKAADFTSIKQDTDFYAAYELTVNRYHVTWMINGRAIVQEYAYGEIPSYRNWEQTFTDDHYEYTFTGWSPAVRQVTGDATYTALFRVRSLSDAVYAVTFTVGDRQVYRSYAFGETPVFDDFEKEYMDGDSRYTFTGWDKAFEPLTSDMQYTAQFERTWLVPAGENGTVGAQVSETSRTLTVVTDEMVADVSWAVARAKSAGLELSLTLGKATLTLDAKAIDALSDVVTVRIAPAATEEGMSYVLFLNDRSGKAITPGTEMLMALPLTEELMTAERIGAYIDGEPLASTKDGEFVYLRPVSGGTVSVRPTYVVTVGTEGNGALLCEAGHVLSGDTVELTAHAEQGWRLASMTAVTSDGKPITVTDGRLVMPASDVTVTAVFEQIEYSVVFMNGTREISRANYHFGDTVELPTDPTWEGEIAEGEIYTFSGWSPVVVPVAEDAVYTAEYTKTNAADVIDPTVKTGNPVLTVVLIAAAAAVLAAGVAAVWFVKRKKGGKM